MATRKIIVGVDFSPQLRALQNELAGEARVESLIASAQLASNARKRREMSE